MDNNEKELLEKIEKAAEKGARKGSKKLGIPSLVITIVIVVLLAFIVVPKVLNVSKTFNSIFSLEENVEGHDTTLTNHGFFGYKSADFEEAILGDTSKLKKVEVYKQEVSDAATVTSTKLFNLSIFSKRKVITYKGTAVYTVDLSALKRDCIELDTKTHTVTMHIPHAVQEEINIPEDGIEIGDAEKGLLAFGDLNVSLEDNIRIQAGVREAMEEKLAKDGALDTADKFAKLVIWEMYTPIVKSVASNYSLEVIVDR